MAEAHLGDTIDIHAGGVDLQFPHHENEVAQSECAHGGRTAVRALVAAQRHAELRRRQDGEVGRQHPARPRPGARTSAGSAALCPAVGALPAAAGMVGWIGRTIGAHAGPACTGRCATSPTDATPRASRTEHRGCARRRPQHAGRRWPRSPASPARRAKRPIDRQRLKGEMLGAGRVLGLLQQDPPPRGSRAARPTTRRCAHPGADRRTQDRRRKVPRFRRADAIRNWRPKTIEEDTPSGTRRACAGSRVISCLFPLAGEFA